MYVLESQPDRQFPYSGFWANPSAESTHIQTLVFYYFSRRLWMVADVFKKYLTIKISTLENFNITKFKFRFYL